MPQATLQTVVFAYYSKSIQAIATVRAQTWKAIGVLASSSLAICAIGLIPGFWARVLGMLLGLAWSPAAPAFTPLLLQAAMVLVFEHVRASSLAMKAGRKVLLARSLGVGAIVILSVVITPHAGLLGQSLSYFLSTGIMLTAALYLTWRGVGTPIVTRR